MKLPIRTGHYVAIANRQGPSSAADASCHPRKRTTTCPHLVLLTPANLPLPPQPHPRLPATTSAASAPLPARGPAPCAAVPTVVTPDNATGVFEELAAGQQRKYIMISGKVGAARRLGRGELESPKQPRSVTQDQPKWERR